MNREKVKSVLNRELAVVKQAYDKLAALAPIDEFSFNSLDKSKALVAENWLRTIYVHGEIIDKIVQRLVVDGELPLQEVAISISRFYENEYFPNREKLRELYLESFLRDLDLEDLRIELPNISDEPENKQDIVEEEEIGSELLFMFESAIDNWEFTMELNAEDDSYVEHIENAREILRAGYFTPDNWVANTKLLKPILSSYPSNKIPSHAKFRLKEIYRSFVLGNWIAVISLCRSLLEYTLIYRASNLGFDAFYERRGVRTTKNLVDLVEEASEKKPGLKNEMEAVREYGNRVLHPKKKDKIILFPHIMRKTALESIEAIRKVVLELYA